jgi:hypothetical protein
MPSTTLLDNLNSDFLSAFSVLQPKGSAQRVLVYVESDEDIAFWRSILNPFEVQGICFDVQLPSRTGLEKGKKVALERSQDLLSIPVGTHLIVCVDSDYDFLLQNKTETSSKINNSDFIFQTYSYSIENLQCYSGSLQTICTQATKNDKRVIDFEELTKFYSKIIYDLFLWSVRFSFKHDTTSFSLHEFCDTIKVLGKADVIENFATALSELKAKVDEKIKELQNDYSDEIVNVKVLKEELKHLGVTEDNIYLFAQGHTIKDNVILMFLNPILKQLQNEKFQQIKLSARTPVELENQINHYKNQIIPIKTVLNSNTEFKSCFLYQKIQNDLEKYVQTMKSLFAQ